MDRDSSPSPGAAGGTGGGPAPTPGADPDRISAFASFRERNFAIMWTASLLSQTGQWLQNVAVPFVVFQITGSGAWLGFTAFMMLVPMVLLGPVAGSVADRFDRRKVLAIGAALQGLITAGLWLTWASGVRSVWVLIVLVTAVSSVAGVTVASWQAFVPSLVPRRLLLNAVTLNSAQFNAARAFGPAIGGVVIATAGPSWAFFLNAISFFAIVGGLALVRLPRIERERPAGRPRALAEMWSALRYVRTQRGILASLVVVFTLGLLGGPLFNLVVVFAQEVYDVGDGAYGLLAACIGIGSIMAAPILAGWGSRQPRSAMVSLAMVGYGCALVAFGAAPVYAVGALALLVSGAGYLGLASTLNTTLQMQVSEVMRGRVLALYVMSLTAAMPIGNLVQGSLVDVIGPQWTVAGAGLLFLGVYAVLRLGTDLLDHMDDEPSEPGPSEDGPSDGELRLDVAAAKGDEAAAEAL